MADLTGVAPLKSSLKGMPPSCAARRKAKLMGGRVDGIGDAERTAIGVKSIDKSLVILLSA